MMPLYLHGKCTGPELQEALIARYMIRNKSPCFISLAYDYVFSFSLPATIQDSLNCPLPDACASRHYCAGSVNSFIGT